MSDRKAKVAVIGDIVRSKEAPDRARLQEALAASLRAVNSRLKPFEELEPTVGDEVQGVFSDLAAAVRATLLLRLELLKKSEIDSRYGIGLGSITVFEDQPRITQDGPGWWSARAAIDRVEEMAGQTRTPFLRTRFELPEERVKVSRREAAAVNAFLVNRDAIVGQMAPRSRRLLLGLLNGRLQAELAEEEGIYQSAVSQNLAQSGAYAIVAAEQELDAR